MEKPLFVRTNHNINQSLTHIPLILRPLKYVTEGENDNNTFLLLTFQEQQYYCYVFKEQLIFDFLIKDLSVCLPFQQNYYNYIKWL